jgi:predicted RNA-binding protein associated with RNAse of E/G family
VVTNSGAPSCDLSGGCPEIRIHYLRPPDRITVYRQHLVHDDGRVKVTLARDLPLDPPLRIGGRIALERGSDAVWFTFPGAWHDIGRFYRSDGTFSGLYANLITPCIFQPGGDWETTDLYLDLWIPAALPPATWRPSSDGGEDLEDASPQLLDGTELERAESQGHVSRRLAERARTEAASLLARAAGGIWPPDVVHAWPRRRALQVLRGDVSSED